VREKNPERLSAVRAVLGRGLVALADRLGVSGVHITFSTREECTALRREGFVPRLGLQYHWHNHNYRSFEDYLATLKQGRRKAIRQERRKVREAGLTIRRLRGEQISSSDWSSFYQLYMATVQRKWGHEYLKRGFFDELGASMGERVLLLLAEDAQGEVVGGALNLIGSDCIYGRTWGCARHIDSLHFELCYYQVIEMAIELGLARVEAGAQGEHKIARGYLPTLTHSAHYLRDPGFRSAISRAVTTEREQTYIALAVISTKQNPYKAPPERHLSSQGLKIDGGRILVRERPLTTTQAAARDQAAARGQEAAEETTDTAASADDSPGAVASNGGGAAAAVLDDHDVGAVSLLRDSSLLREPASPLPPPTNPSSSSSLASGAVNDRGAVNDDPTHGQCAI